jgi:hypothetical protein
MPGIFRILKRVMGSNVHDSGEGMPQPPAA